MRLSHRCHRHHNDARDKSNDLIKWERETANRPFGLFSVNVFTCWRTISHWLSFHFDAFRMKFPRTGRHLTSDQLTRLTATEASVNVAFADLMSWLTSSILLTLSTVPMSIARRIQCRRRIGRWWDLSRALIALNTIRLSARPETYGAKFLWTTHETSAGLRSTEAMENRVATKFGFDSIFKCQFFSWMIDSTSSSCSADRENSTILPASMSRIANRPTRKSPMTFHFSVRRFGSQLWLANRERLPRGPASITLRQKWRCIPMISVVTVTCHYRSLSSTRK